MPQPFYHFNIQNREKCKYTKVFGFRKIDMGKLKLNGNINFLYIYYICDRKTFTNVKFYV